MHPSQPVGSSGVMRRFGSHGFTMVELIVVLILVGILAATAAGRFIDRRAFDVPAYAEQVRAMLRYAQKAAIARNAAVFVRFEDNRIFLCHANPSSGCGAGQQVLVPGNFNDADDATRSQCGAGNWYCLGKPAGISWTAAPSPDWLMFDPLGRPVLPGNVSSGLALTISGGQDSASILVTEETGYVQ